MLVQELDNIKEIIFGVVLSVLVYRPEVLLSNSQQHLHLYVFDFSSNFSSIDTMKTKCFIEITVLPEETSNFYEQDNDVSKGKPLEIRI